ncbi:hypothetical protein K2173_028483 [Erythroxylum novogranatense]|uniref:CCHC-type domain-containing protein n=1 Tax=Erythroxylum novogranatense TaxID=1862640 RepID=A0AAV8U1Z6_9ROSI|nr:hypothetical protein K2173_028483 [Erythroxylum novogranatense]
MARYHPSIYNALGNLVGRTVKIDNHTQLSQRGKFARVAVDVDLSAPLCPCVELDGEIIRVAYEGLPQICFECGRVGHGAPTCPIKPARPPVSVQPYDNPTVPTQLDNNSASSSESLHQEEYSPWMQVTCRPCRHQLPRWPKVSHILTATPMSDCEDRNS